MDDVLVESYFNYIAGKVFDEDEIVTYKSLSRNLNIHVNTAKQLLYTYMTNEKSKNTFPISATYLIAGKVIDGSFEISVVNESDLKTACSNLIQITSKHVYSLQKGKNIKEMNYLCVVDKESCSKSFKPVIKHFKNALEENEEVVNEPYNNETEKKQIIKSIVGTEKETEATHKEKISPKVENQKVQLSNKKPVGNIVHMFAKANKEKLVKESFKDRPGSDIDCIYNEKKKEEKVTERGSSKRKIESKENLKGKKKAGNKRRRIQVLPDSEDSEDDEEEEKQQYVEVGEEEDAPYASILNLEDEIEETKELSSKNKRKKRKVVDKTVVNEDGYLVTRKEVVFETDSEDETEEVPKPKEEKGKGAKSSKKQSSLLLFFKKS